MLGWVIEVAYAFILTLMEWQEEGAVGEAKAAASLISAVVLPVGGFFLIIRSQARRKYQKAIEEINEVRNEVDAKNEAIARLRQENADRDREIARLGAMAPEGFARAMDAHHRDGNTEHEVRDAQAYIDFHRPALRRAHGVIVDDLIGHAASEGVTTYAIALSHAQAALTLTPDDEMLRELAAELSQAATIAPNLRVTLPTPAERAGRLKKRAALPNDLAALEVACNSACDVGNPTISLKLAEHGVRLAKRASGTGSLTEIYWRCLEARALINLGRAGEALKYLQPLRILPAAADQANPTVLSFRYYLASCLRHVGESALALAAARELLPDMERVKGADYKDTFATRFLIASALRGTGDTVGAMEAARDLSKSQQKVLGKEHPHTLRTRQLVARCLFETGDASGALDAVRDLLPTMQRKLGDQHPDTLTTRTLEAQSLLALARIADARAAHKGVAEGLLKAGLPPTHGFVRGATDLDARLAAAG